jgi:hypothetical protein
MILNSFFFTVVATEGTNSFRVSVPVGNQPEVCRTRETISVESWSGGRDSEGNVCRAEWGQRWAENISAHHLTAPPHDHIFENYSTKAKAVTLFCIRYA